MSAIEPDTFTCVTMAKFAVKNALTETGSAVFTSIVVSSVLDGMITVRGVLFGLPPKTLRNAIPIGGTNSG